MKKIYHLGNCSTCKRILSEIHIDKDVVLQDIKEEDVNFEQFKSKLEDFRFRDEDKVGEVFDKQNNFRTSVRGVKVRGVFDTKREADVRASVLQRMDPLFDVFVGQIGFWCPWDPNPQKIVIAPQRWFSNPLISDASLVPSEWERI